MAEFIPPKRVTRRLTNRAFGYPRGSERKVKAEFLMVIHITGNKRTATMPDGVKPGSGAWAELSYADRSDSNGPSAHVYLARNGEALMAIDPSKHAAWSNGDLTNPDTSIPMVRRMVSQARKGINPNELVHREVECVGFPGTHPVTAQQRETLAYLIARDSLATGLPIGPGTTVGVHRWINTVDRRNCPFTGDAMRQVTAICKRARVIKTELTAEEPPEEPPDPPVDPCEEIRDELEAATGYAEKLEDERANMLAVFARIGRLVESVRDGD